MNFYRLKIFIFYCLLCYVFAACNQRNESANPEKEKIMQNKIDKLQIQKDSLLLNANVIKSKTDSLGKIKKCNDSLQQALNYARFLLNEAQRLQKKNSSYDEIKSFNLKCDNFYKDFPFFNGELRKKEASPINNFEEEKQFDVQNGIIKNLQYDTSRQRRIIKNQIDTIKEKTKQVNIAISKRDSVNSIAKHQKDTTVYLRNKIAKRQQEPLFLVDVSIDVKTKRNFLYKKQGVIFPSKSINGFVVNLTAKKIIDTPINKITVYLAFFYPPDSVFDAKQIKLAGRVYNYSKKIELEFNHELDIPISLPNYKPGDYYAEVYIEHPFTQFPLIPNKKSTIKVKR